MFARLALFYAIHCLAERRQVYVSIPSLVSSGAPRTTGSVAVCRLDVIVVGPGGLRIQEDCGPGLHPCGGLSGHAALLWAPCLRGGRPPGRGLPPGNRPGFAGGPPGQGRKAPEVYIPQELKSRLKTFLTWKRAGGEDVSDGAPVFVGQRSPSPATACGAWSGPHGGRGPGPRYATHTCRHTDATHLCRASGADLEIVQEQLGHASIKTTTIYAKVTKEDKARAADALAKAFQNSQRNRTSGAGSPQRSPGSAGKWGRTVATF